MGASHFLDKQQVWRRKVQRKDRLRGRRQRREKPTLRCDRIRKTAMLPKNEMLTKGIWHRAVPAERLGTLPGSRSRIGSRGRQPLERLPQRQYLLGHGVSRVCGAKHQPG